ncbi:MAG: hypothetical protein KC620_08310 [Myxococcales bacterium]|nr:hypothetical protein [Myxococcales bacterium]
MEPAARFTYEIEVDAPLDTLSATLCFADMPPRWLIPGLAGGQRWLRGAPTRLRAGQAAPLRVSARGIELPASQPGDCVRYRVDLAALAEDFGTEAEGPVRATRVGEWLWRPPALPTPQALRVTARFKLPAGLALSCPWPARGDGGFDVPWNAFRYRGRVTFGAFERWTLPVAGGRLDVARLGSRFRTPRAALDRWLTDAGRAAATIYGRLPVPAIQVTLVGDGGDDVGFGGTQRGGGPGVILYVGVDVTPAALDTDWTAAHELLHLGMPPVDRADAWLSEGIVTYLAYVALTRIGHRTPEALFEELAAGFGRGRLFGTGRPLGAESAAMYQTYAFWRVYWGGAAWALQRDIELRRAGSSLDAAMRLWQRQALAPGPTRPAADLLRAADRGLDGRFTTTAEAALARVDFPDMEPFFAGLGVRFNGRRAQFEPAPDAAIRDALTAPAR